MTGINCIEYQHGQSRELVRISRYSMISEHMIRSNWTLPHFSKKSSIFVHAGYFRKKGSHCCHYTNKNQMVKWWAAQLTSDQQLLRVMRRRAYGGRMALKTKDQLLSAISSGLRSLQRKRKKILGFFRAEHTACACLENFDA